MKASAKKVHAESLTEPIVIPYQPRKGHTDAERNRHYQRLRRRSRIPSKSARLEEAQYSIYSQWFVLPIREMMLHSDFREDPAWIGRRLRPRVSPTEVRRALAPLPALGLAATLSRGGWLVAGSNWGAPKLLDAFTSTAWHSSAGPAQNTKWMKFGLAGGQTYQIDRFQLLGRQDCCFDQHPADFEIAVSTTGISSMRRIG